MECIHGVPSPAKAIEDPGSKLRGIFDRKECGLLMIRSHFPPQAAGNALALAVHISSFEFSVNNGHRLFNPFLCQHFIDSGSNYHTGFYLR